MHGHPFDRAWIRSGRRFIHGHRGSSRALGDRLDPRAARLDGLPGSGVLPAFAASHSALADELRWAWPCRSRCCLGERRPAWLWPSSCAHRCGPRLQGPRVQSPRPQGPRVQSPRPQGPSTPSVLFPQPQTLQTAPVGPHCCSTQRSSLLSGRIRECSSPGRWWRAAHGRLAPACAHLQGTLLILDEPTNH